MSESKRVYHRLIRELRSAKPLAVLLLCVGLSFLRSSFADASEAAFPSLEQINSVLDAMSLEEKIAQLFLIQPEALVNVDGVTEAGEITRSALNEFPIGGFIYMEQNLLEESQVKTMISNVQTYSMERIGLPLFISVDEEGGTVARISGRNFDVPLIGDMAQIGSSGDPKLAYETGRTIGSYLSGLGFNLDFAPVADVLDTPDHQLLLHRSFGSDPTLVASMATELLKGLRDEGIYGTLKHFPGHGAATEDTHLGYSGSKKALEELKSCDLIPFMEGIDAGADFIMVGHLSFPNITGDELPSSLSGRIVTDLLRDELGYDGIVITDALNMGAISQNYTSAQAAVMALEAGADLILMPSNFHEAYDGVLEAVRQQRITESRIDESLRRILKIKISLP